MADNTNRLAGIAYIAVNGQNYMLFGSLSYGVSTVSRTTLTGQDRVHGYSETPHPGFIAATLRDAGTLKVADFNAMTQVNVTLELANGKIVVGAGMWTTDAQEVDTAEGTFAVRWEGPSVEEVN